MINSLWNSYSYSPQGVFQPIYRIWLDGPMVKSHPKDLTHVGSSPYVNISSDPSRLNDRKLFLRSKGFWFEPHCDDVHIWLFSDSVRSNSRKLPLQALLGLGSSPKKSILCLSSESVRSNGSYLPSRSLGYGFKHRLNCVHVWLSSDSARLSGRKLSPSASGFRFEPRCDYVYIWLVFRFRKVEE